MNAKAKSAKKKNAFMKANAFAELMAGMHQVLAFEHGEKTEADGYRVTRCEIISAGWRGRAGKRRESIRRDLRLRV